MQALWSMHMERAHERLPEPIVMPQQIGALRRRSRCSLQAYTLQLRARSAEHERYRNIVLMSHDL